MQNNWNIWLDILHLLGQFNARPSVQDVIRDCATDRSLTKRLQRVLRVGDSDYVVTLFFQNCSSQMQRNRIILDTEDKSLGKGYWTQPTKGLFMEGS